MTHINYKVEHLPNDQKQIMTLINQKVLDGVKVNYLIKTSNGKIIMLKIDTKDKDIKNLVSSLGYTEE